MGRSEEITGLKYDKSLYTDCGFYAGDMDDSYIEEEEKLVKCRKPHKCSACQRDINKGEYAVRETAIFPGEGRRSCLYMHYMHRSMAGRVRAGRRGG